MGTNVPQGASVTTTSLLLPFHDCETGRKEHHGGLGRTFGGGFHIFVVYLRTFAIPQVSSS